MSLKINGTNKNDRFCRSTDGGVLSAPKLYTQKMELAYKQFLQGDLYPEIRCYFKDKDGNKIYGPCKPIKVKGEKHILLWSIRPNHPKARYREIT